MSGFIRRYLQDPGTAELLAIEGVVIIDREPTSQIIGTGSGTVCLVAEFEKGPYSPLEVSGGQDVVNQFGAFGFTYNGIAGNYPCARSRKADAAITPEYWNGNGYVAMAGKTFSRLILTRVDTTVGAVSLTRLAYLAGNSNLTWKLVAGQVLGVKVDGGAVQSVTFAAAAAVMTSGTGTYPTGFSGANSVSLLIDEGTDREVSVDVTIPDTDTTKANIITRINTAVGFTLASDAGTSAIALTGRVQGLSGNVQILAATAPFLTATGFAVSAVDGTGSAQNIASVTYAEAKARIEAATTGVTVERDASGNLLLVSDAITGAPSIAVDLATTTATAFGFPLDTVATNVTVGVSGTLPAGILVTNSSGTQHWVTAADQAITPLNPGPYTVRVRPATDDGTETSAAPGVVTTIAAQPADFGIWHVTNVLALTAALTEAALDAAYSDAIDRTLNPNSVAKQANIIVSARQSNATRYKIRSNALDASAHGLFGRMGIIRPPLGTTTRAQARSNSAQPGVGAYRDQRVAYAFPGGVVNIPAIARLGTDGGVGFTANGNIDVGSDTWLAAIMSRLPPEENPGQLTDFASNLLGIETGNPDVQDMTELDYRAFRAAGIAALRMDNGVAIFQSGVTSVDPAQFPGLKNIARRRMADYCQDSLAVGLRPFSKKLNGRTRRALVIGMIQGFLSTLKSSNNAETQRIEDFIVDYKSGNTSESIAAGLFRVIIKIRTLSSMDVIVLDTEIGEGVLIIKQAA